MGIKYLCFTVSGTDFCSCGEGITSVLSKNSMSCGYTEYIICKKQLG